MDYEMISNWSFKIGSYCMYVSPRILVEAFTQLCVSTAAPPESRVDSQEETAQPEHRP